MTALKDLLANQFTCKFAFQSVSSFLSNSAAAIRSFQLSQFWATLSAGILCQVYVKFMQRICMNRFIL